MLATTAIEGNTLTEEEVLKHLDKKLNLPPSKAYLATEVDNIVTACQFIADAIFRGQQREVSKDLIQEFNRLVLKDLKLEEGIVAGELRQFRVGVGRYGAVPAEDCEYLLEELCLFLNSDLGGLKADPLIIGVIKAIFGHAYFELIHPFGDGNGRTGRLIEFFILLASGVPTAASHLLSNFYNQTRAEYYRQLDAISQSKGDMFPFFEYAVSGLLDGLKEQVMFIQHQQASVIWTNYIHERFRADNTSVGKRRRDLALAISASFLSTGKATTSEQLLSSNAAVAMAYAKKTKKTLQRDIKTLEQLQVIEETESGVVPRIGLLQALHANRVET